MGAVGAGAGSGAAEGRATGTDSIGDVVRTTLLLRAVTDNPVTTRTDTGDFGSSSVNKENT